MIGPGLARRVCTLMIAVAPLAGAVSTVRVAAGFVSPVDIVNAGDGSGRLFVAEQGGTIRIIAANGVVASTPFLDISGRVVAGGEQGLLGIAFHPRYRGDGRFFVDYTRKADGATVIASFRVDAADANRADPASERVLLTVPQPFANHNGGALRFGPDGLLYIGMGDGGAANDPDGHAQDPHSLLGKLLRIDVDNGRPYAIPAGNAFADEAQGRPEIFALGLRNPWRVGFDRATGDLYVGDVGQDRYEEVDYVPAGLPAGMNFGWRMAEGLHCTTSPGPVTCTDASLAKPIVEYGHEDGCSITGGTVYRGTVPALAARYVFADFCSGRVWSAGRTAGGAWLVRDVVAYDHPISAFGEDERGEIHFLDYARGEVRRFQAEDTDRVDAVEYYHAGLDHYFLSAEPSDVNALDAGALSGWTRTGETIAFFGPAAAGATGVYRFYIPPALGDSHFITADAAEAEDVRRRFPAFVEEGPLVMHAVLPERTNGACPAATRPVYRVWNRRVDSNHRYMTDAAVRDAMVAQGGVAEGYGADAVALCAAE